MPAFLAPILGRVGAAVAGRAVAGGAARAAGSAAAGGAARAAGGSAAGGAARSILGSGLGKTIGRHMIASAVTNTVMGGVSSVAGGLNSSTDQPLNPGYFSNPLTPEYSDNGRSGCFGTGCSEVS